MRTRTVLRSSGLAGCVGALVGAAVVAATMRSGVMAAAPVASAGVVDGARLPTVFVVGDSLVKTKVRGSEGWGDELGAFFDPKKAVVENDAHAGESSRTLYLLDLWNGVKPRLKKGDFVLIEFSVIENKSTMNFTRYTLPGIGAEDEEGVDQRTGEKFRIHTYGWYLNKFVEETRAAGATPLLVSPVGRVRWAGGKTVRGENDFAKWTADEAKAAGVGLIDLNAVAAGSLRCGGRGKGPDLFAGRDKHDASGCEGECGVRCAGDFGLEGRCGRGVGGGFEGGGEGGSGSGKGGERRIMNDENADWGKCGMRKAETGGGADASGVERLQFWIDG